MRSMGIAVALAATAGVAHATDRAITDRAVTDRAILPADALADVRALTAPALAGRGTLGPGLGGAARYIAGRFAAAGLVPAGDGDAGSFFQTVEIPLPRRPSPESLLELEGVKLTLGGDYAANVGSAAGAGRGRIAFAGQGAAADFVGLDVRGKLVVVLPGGPVLAEKLESAIGLGAVALISIDAAASTDVEVAPLPTLGRMGASGIASFRVRAAAIDQLLSRLVSRSLAPTGKTVAALRAAVQAGDRRAATFDLPAWGTFRLEWTERSIKGCNVAGMIPGHDPALAGEAVLVGAHYDHLGQGDEGGALDGPGLHPGADDNASGIAALLEMAEEIAAAPARGRRAILFMAFTGEEKGLVGSVTAASRAPREVVAMINFDMVGRMRQSRLEIHGASTSPVWRSLVEASNADGLALAFPPRVPKNSDHAPFVRGGVPALLFHTGLHADYHRRTDTADRINADGIVRAARLGARVVRLLGDRTERLPFTSPGWSDARVGGGGTP